MHIQITKLLRKETCTVFMDFQLVCPTNFWPVLICQNCETHSYNISKLINQKSFSSKLISIISLHCTGLPKTKLIINSCSHKNFTLTSYICSYMHMCGWLCGWLCGLSSTHMIILSLFFENLTNHKKFKIIFHYSIYVATYVKTL